MTTPSLIDSSGRSISLGPQVGTGGEGSVFALSNGDHVAKIYHNSPTLQTQDKLRAMIALTNAELLKVAAWPMGLLFHARTRQPAGFMMPRIVDCQPIQHLYNPAMRLRSFPKAGWDFQIRTARNLAAAFDEIHKAGCLVGDVNQSNAMVSSKAMVKLIDCDSFQVRANGKQYLCEVGVPHYTPPELQGKQLRGVVRTENHDRFGLAVLIFQLLFVGRHPYAGVFQGKGDPSFEQLIAEFRFAHGPKAHSWQMGPPLLTPAFDDIPPELGGLFRRAFERGSEIGTRPLATQWLQPLDQLLRNLADCVADSGHKYWKGTRGCVWCRLAANNGPDYYYGVADDSGTFSVDEEKLRGVQKRLEAARLVDFPYDRARYSSGKSLQPNPLPSGLEEHHSTATVLGLVGGACFLAMPLGFVHRVFLVVGLLGSLVFGLWCAILVFQSPLQHELRRRRKARTLALADVEGIEDEWEGHLKSYRRDRSASMQAINGLISECRSLETLYQSEFRQLSVTAEANARIRHLRLHLLADAEIEKIGTMRKQMLASHGIFTAADVEWNRVYNIKGFGNDLTGRVVAWKDDVLRQFRFDPKSGVSPADRKTLTVRVRTRQQQILAEIDRRTDALEALATKCRARVDTLKPLMREAVAEWEQTEADLELLERRT